MRSATVFVCGVMAFFATVTTLTLSAWCAGPDWMLLDESRDSRFYYDRGSTNSPSKGIFRVSTRVVYTEEGKKEALKILATARNFGKLFESRYLHDLDCRNEKSRLLKVTHLDENGAILKSTELASFTEWEEIPPDARMGQVAEKVCTP